MSGAQEKDKIKLKRRVPKEKYVFSSDRCARDKDVELNLGSIARWKSM